MVWSVATRVVRWSSVSIALVAVSLASCAHEPFPPVSVLTPAGASSEEMRWVIEAALATHNWKVVDRGANSMTASVRSAGSGDFATVQINYGPGAVDIECVKQDVSRQRYDRWIHLLSTEVKKNAALLGGRRQPAPRASGNEDGRPPQPPTED